MEFLVTFSITKAPTQNPPYLQFPWLKGHLKEHKIWIIGTIYTFQIFIHERIPFLDFANTAHQCSVQAILGVCMWSEKIV